ncbi:NAD-dependent epimerase/dehydratase family protein [Salinibacterium sp. dk2585]|uniref:NAD-dependent epimerase/dehydratase family protein n=1 Tax=unclassified Salinibacterium TaxID=2632331 RepID=UPI0011C24E52|nr:MULTISPECIES: NAD-dependent epimerase/dehydratase family protein [unclassified Salinibacterium]QEE60856.1 NAD-dependent epimerase/dehydratase family protein [Salinibacterium sp. dk2585]TXK55928.1 NAD-dependent epimerase/dehydratase family protein [Salinibacterium sp. dk5596]
MRVVVTGAAGMLGSSIVQQWPSLRPDDELVALTRDVVDLRDASATAEVIGQLRPDAIIHAAARVAGIADKLERPATFLQENIQLDSSIISAAIAAEVPEFLYISSGAIYPADVRQPIIESDLLGGPLEGANEGYALAKIAGTKLCEYASRQYGWAYRAAVPSNLYGPGDDFRPGRAHLVASTIAKADDAVRAGDDSLPVWGDGTARREFTYAPDLAAWLVSQVGALEAWPPMLNLGVGVDHSIREYYEAAARAVGFAGTFDYDTSKPSGVMQRLLDSSRARALGWNPTTTLDEGYAATTAAYLASHTSEQGSTL